MSCDEFEHDLGNGVSAAPFVATKWCRVVVLSVIEPIYLQRTDWMIIG
jgi:hypothetical protein